jgi:pimeloyl-ACP methyl ester carboxylesterase
MSETITTPEGGFTAEVAGAPGAPLVLLLHGFPQSRHVWRHQMPALARAGYRAVAPDQRGYSPGVRPDPAGNPTAYGIDRLVADVLDLAGALGCGDPTPFHLVGHDWGGQVAWIVAARHPARVASLTVLSRPHPTAFRRAFRQDADDQRHRSRHHKTYQDPATVTVLLEEDARRLRKLLAEQNVPEPAIAEYRSVVGNPPALDAALAWYRAAGAVTNLEVDPVTVPTLYIWGDRDAMVGRAAAKWTAEFVKGPFRLEMLRGVGHFVTDQVPGDVTKLLLAHLAAPRPA